MTPRRRAGQIATTLALMGLGVLFGLAPLAAYLVVLAIGVGAGLVFLIRALTRR